VCFEPSRACLDPAAPAGSIPKPGILPLRPQFIISFRERSIADPPRVRAVAIRGLICALMVIAVLLIAGCASEKLALAPPSGVDFSGHWKLNEADSDDPQRVVLSQNAAPRPAPADPPAKAARGAGPRSGRGGRAAAWRRRSLGSRDAGHERLSDGLRWPGRQLDIEQSAGVVTIASLAPRRSTGGRRRARNDRETRARDRAERRSLRVDGKTLVCSRKTPTMSGRLRGTL